MLCKEVTSAVSKTLKIKRKSESQIPFVSHRVSYPLIRDSVYRFHSAYVHEFPDKSVLLEITQHTKMEAKDIEVIREFTWTPKIGAIHRPASFAIWAYVFL